MSKLSIFIYENDKVFANGLKNELNLSGYDITVTTTINDAIKEARAGIHLFLIAYRGDSRTELKLIREIRKIGGSITPVVVMLGTDGKRRIKDAYDAGCSHHIKKPFEIKNLFATIGEVEQLYSNKVILHKNLIYKLDTQELFYKSELVELSKSENILLDVLVRSRGLVVSCELISAHIWGKDRKCDLNSVRSLVCRLRKKLVEDNIIFTALENGYGLK